MVDGTQLQHMACRGEGDTEAPMGCKALLAHCKVPSCPPTGTQGGAAVLCPSVLASILVLTTDLWTSSSFLSFYRQGFVFFLQRVGNPSLSCLHAAHCPWYGILATMNHVPLFAPFNPFWNPFCPLNATDDIDLPPLFICYLYHTLSTVTFETKCSHCTRLCAKMK